MIAEYARLDMDAAFSALRLYARNKNERLVDVAHAVAARSLAAADIVTKAPRPPRPRRRELAGMTRIDANQTRASRRGRVPSTP